MFEKVCNVLCGNFVQIETRLPTRFRSRYGLLEIFKNFGECVLSPLHKVKLRFL